MVSSITTKGAQATLEALELGAVDYVEKPGGTVSLDIDSVRNDLIVKIEAAAQNRDGAAVLCSGPGMPPRAVRSLIRARPPKTWPGSS